MTLNIWNHRCNKTKRVSRSVVLSLLLTVYPITLQALASGSHSAYSQDLNDRYDLGKKIFQEKLICNTCPYAETKLTADQLLEVLPALNHTTEIGGSLSVIERQSVKYFIKKRFGL